MDKELLHQRMRRYGFSQEAMAGVIGVERTTLNRKIHGANKGFFLVEIYAIGKALQLTRKELTEIFLDDYGE